MLTTFNIPENQKCVNRYFFRVQPDSLWKSLDNATTYKHVNQQNRFLETPSSMTLVYLFCNTDLV